MRVALNRLVALAMCWDRRGELARLHHNSTCAMVWGAKGLVPYVPAGDGAGILVAIPHLFLSKVVEKECGIELPPLVRLGEAGNFEFRLNSQGRLLAMPFCIRRTTHHTGRCKFGQSSIVCLSACSWSMCICRATMLWARCSCHMMRRHMRRQRQPFTRWQPTRGTLCWAGAEFPQTIGAVRC